MKYTPFRLRTEFFFSADAILRSVCQRLEIEGVSTHSFRRTALTPMSDAGVPLGHIQAISGHKTSPVKVKLVKAESLAQSGLMTKEKQKVGWAIV